MYGSLGRILSRNGLLILLDYVFIFFAVHQLIGSNLLLLGSTRQRLSYCWRKKIDIKELWQTILRISRWGLISFALLIHLLSCSRISRLRFTPQFTRSSVDHSVMHCRIRNASLVTWRSLLLFLHHQWRCSFSSWKFLISQLKKRAKKRHTFIIEPTLK